MQSWSGMFYLVMLLLIGCMQQQPLRLGFIAGTSGRVADLGVGGRNGAILAIEQRNAAGGIKGRRIELLMKDDQQNPEVGKQAVNELIQSNVAAIIGPMTSVIAMAVEPIATQHKVLMMGATVATNDLSGKDDYFFRTISATRHQAAQHAEFHVHHRLQRFAIAYDTRNRAYTESWMMDFRNALEHAKGKVIGVFPFESSEQVPFQTLAQQLVARRADGIVIVSNSVDAALLIQQIRKLDKHVVLGTSEWAGTERLIELGGRAVEGVTLAQYLDRYSKEPRYQAFHQAYLHRFGQEPGFPGLVVYNATNVVLDALVAQQPGEELKQTLLRLKSFPGLQEQIEFDAYGDARSRTYITRIQDGKFVLAE